MLINSIMTHIDAYRKLSINDLKTEAGNLLINSQSGIEFFDLVVNNGTVIDLTLDNGIRAQILFTFFPDANGIVICDGSYGTVGCLHERRDTDNIQMVIDWYNNTTSNSTVYKENYWYGDKKK
jgi:hypothetical protein